MKKSNVGRLHRSTALGVRTYRLGRSLWLFGSRGYGLGSVRRGALDHRPTPVVNVVNCSTTDIPAVAAATTGETAATSAVAAAAVMAMMPMPTTEETAAKAAVAAGRFTTAAVMNRRGRAAWLLDGTSAAATMMRMVAVMAAAISEAPKERIRLRFEHNHRDAHDREA